MTTLDPPSDPSLMERVEREEPVKSVIPELANPLGGSSTSPSPDTDSPSEETLPETSTSYETNTSDTALSLEPTFNIILSGTLSFEHEVGGSACPQSAGNVSAELSNGHSLRLSGLSISGSLASRLDLSVAGNVINAFFNCSSSTNGEFTGTVTGTATDQTDGTSKSFSLSAVGYVGG